MNSPEANIVVELPAPGKELIDEARASAPSRDMHDRLFGQIPALRQIERVSPRDPLPAPTAMTVAAWNAERGNHRDSAVALLRRSRAGVVLLSELDIGMARSGNRHTLREFANPLGAGYMFATEFIELGLGDSRERARFAGQDNAIAIHGNAILSRHRLADPARIALDDSGIWFDGERNGERRIGGRIAIAARLADAPKPVWFVSLHLESHSDPENRSEQIQRVLRGIAQIAKSAPVVIGGDLNTKVLPREPKALAAAFDTIVEKEPLFARFETAGYEWRAANRPDATQRTRPDGTPKGPFTRIDWLAVKGLSVSNPQTLPAVDPAGNAISDHELITVDIAL